MTQPKTHSARSLPVEVRLVEISKEPVELYKILKFNGMVKNGGEAKGVVAAGQVLVNGKVEIQKRKKIVGGDTIEYNHQKVGIVLAVTTATEVSSAKVTTESIEKKPIITGVGDCSIALDAKTE